jgi:ubiquitin-conjugating enzyme E2 D/E
MNVALKRIQKEIADMKYSIHKEISENISAGPIDSNNLLLWNAVIIGAVGTYYEGGIFRLKITFPKDYPFHPPVINFITKIFHPNIHENGDICLDILKNHWSPAYTISHTLLSIVSLLSDPNPDDPLNTDAAHLYKTNKQMYFMKVQQYIQEYSN